MKFIKEFEETNIKNSEKYKIDDYIIFRGRKNNNMGKILIINNTVIDDLGNNNPYFIEMLSFNCDKILNFWFKNDDIIRKATNDEINEFEMKKKLIKYNL